MIVRQHVVEPVAAVRLDQPLPRERRRLGAIEAAAHDAARMALGVRDRMRAILVAQLVEQGLTQRDGGVAVAFVVDQVVPLVRIVREVVELLEVPDAVVLDVLHVPA